MSLLSRNEKELVFDCCFGLPSAEQTAQVESFLAHSEQAAGIHARIQAAVGPLESLRPAPCPDELAERTIRLLCAIAQGARAAVRLKTTYSCWHRLEDHGPCPSNNIPMKSSS